MSKRLLAVALSAALLFGVTGGLPTRFLSAPASAAEAPAKVSRLTTEHRGGSPIGIDTNSPRFGWQLKSSALGAAQTAYEVRVATSEDRLDSGRADMWSSGKVPSAKSIAVKYDGDQLNASTMYFWTVRVWDEAGKPTRWSRPANFETSLLSSDGAKNWDGAKWISMDGKAPKSAGAPMLRDEVALSGRSVASARLYVSALGTYDAYINGTRVGVKDGNKTSVELLAPGWTNYEHTVNYMSYDVTGLVSGKPRVAVGAVLGNGWWSGRMIASGSKYYNAAGNPLALKAKLLIEFKDGTTQTVVTTPGSDWKATDSGPNVTDDIYDGQKTDARKKASGWSAANFDDSAWSSTVASDYTTRFPTAKVIAYPGDTAKLTPQWDRNPESITVYNQVTGQTESANGKGKIVVDQARSVPDAGAAKDAAVTLSEGDTAVYDMGQNMVGVPGYTLKGEPGTEVQFRFGEMLNDDSAPTTAEPTAGADGPDGSVYLANLRSAKATSTYVIGSNAAETHQDSLSFYGFRYVQVRVLTPGASVSVQDVTGKVATSALRDIGNITTDNAKVNKLFENTRWSQRGNYLWIPTDCPQRDERLGWTGDAQLFTNTGLYNNDATNFLSHFMDGLVDSQDSYGFEGKSYTTVSPGAQAVGFGDASGWDDAGVIIPWTLWQMAGDATVIDRNWKSMTTYMDYIWEKTGDTYAGQGTVTGDWLSFQKTSVDFMSDAYYGYSARLMADMAEASGRDIAAAKYSDLFDNIRAKFVAKYIKTDPGTGKTLVKSSLGGTGWQDGTPEDDSQTAILWALKLGFYENETQRSEMLDSLVANIENGPAYQATHQDSARIGQPENTLSTGFLGVNVLAPVLTEEGRSDKAYELLHQDAMPSWMYSVDNGATTVWERWNSYSQEDGFGPVSMNSFNHYSYGAIVEWMYERMAGISKDPKTPGFKHFFLQPEFDPTGKIKEVEGSFDGPYGLIKSSWKRSSKAFIYNVTVPVNSTATVRISTDSPESLKVGGKSLEDADGVESPDYVDGVASFKVVAGSFQITGKDGAKPDPTDLPKISGVPNVGSTLTVSDGTWSQTGLTFAYQWKRNGANIAGATAATYKVRAADAGASLAAEVAATKSGHEPSTATARAVKIAKIGSSISFELNDYSLSQGQNARATVVVTAKGVPAPIGKLFVKDGSKTIKAVTLGVSDGGKQTFTLPKLSKGSHHISVVYSGSGSVAERRSASRVVKAR